MLIMYEPTECFDDLDYFRKMIIIDYFLFRVSNFDAGAFVVKNNIDHLPLTIKSVFLIFLMFRLFN
jgi:hypothetical protein